MADVQGVSVCGECGVELDMSVYRGESLPCGHDSRKAAVRVVKETPDDKLERALRIALVGCRWSFESFLDHFEISVRDGEGDKRFGLGIERKTVELLDAEDLAKQIKISWGHKRRPEEARL